MLFKYTIKFYLERRNTKKSVSLEEVRFPDTPVLMFLVLMVM